MKLTTIIISILTFTIGLNAEEQINNNEKKPVSQLNWLMETLDKNTTEQQKEKLEEFNNFIEKFSNLMMKESKSQAEKAADEKTLNELLNKIDIKDLENISKTMEEHLIKSITDLENTSNDILKANPETLEFIESLSKKQDNTQKKSNKLIGFYKAMEAITYKSVADHIKQNIIPNYKKMISRANASKKEKVKKSILLYAINWGDNTIKKATDGNTIDNMIKNKIHRIEKKRQEILKQKQK